MQLFITHQNFKRCAADLDDVRLNKIIVEAAQIASTALWMNDCTVAESLYPKIYLPTHEHHPLVKWCAANVVHYMKVCRYGTALCKEYEYRFNKTHKTLKVLLTLYTHFNSIPFGEDAVQPFVNATTHHKHIDDVYEAYRKELTYKWNRDKVGLKWTKRGRPIF